MNLDEIRHVVLTALGDIAPEADLNTLEPEADVREQLDLDSVDFLRFVIAVGKELDIDVPEADYPQLITLESAVSYLASRTERRVG